LMRLASNRSISTSWLTGASMLGETDAGFKRKLPGKTK